MAVPFISGSSPATPSVQVFEEAAAIVLSSELRDEGWLIDGGRVLAFLRDSKVRRAKLDFSALTWADPVPLLALGCGVCEFVAAGGELSIELGGPRTANANRFLIFFARHGFLSLLARNGQIVWNGTSYKHSEVKQVENQLRNLPGVLAYQDSECIPASLFSALDLREPKLRSIVEDLLSSAHPKVSSWLGGNARRRGLLLHRLRVILNESLDNVAEHAYQTGGFGAVFARIRTGIPDEPKAAADWERTRRDESRECPVLHRCNAGKKPGWLELFVCDIGRGLTHRLATDEKAPLLELSGRLFREGVSRHKNRPARRKTSLTGLQRIGHLLGAEATGGGRGDFVRLYSVGEWAGEHLPWPEDGLQASHRNARSNILASVPSGCLLHFAIEPPPAGAQDQMKLYPSYFVVPNRTNLAEVRATLSDNSTDLFARPYNFVDLYVRDVKPRGDRGLVGLRWVSDLSRTTIMIRPSRTERKIDFVAQVLKIANRTDLAAADILFVDVPWSAAIDFGNILRNEQFGSRLLNRSVNVFVISQDWVCAGFTFSVGEGRFLPDSNLSQDFFQGDTQKVSAALVATALRARDSKLFWLEAGDAYLNEPINWPAEDNTSKQQVIWGYLDIALAISREGSYEAAKRSLRRAISSFAEPVVFAADELILPLVHGEFDVEATTPALGDIDRGQGVLVGSVRATGSTIRRFLLMNTMRVRGSAHLLHHPDLDQVVGDIEALIALNWMPPPPKAKRATPIYSRITNTPFIIRGGEAAIPLPRFSEPLEGKLGASLYGESPNEAYLRWQRLGLLRLGHWVYNLHHDLLNLRLLDAFEYDSAEGGPIVDWFVTQINEWIQEALKHQKKLIIVYPQHVVTNRLVRAILKNRNFLNGSIRANIKCFPLPILKIWQSSPIALSPMTRELIGREFKRFERGGIVIFIDDGVVSGKTLRQITQALEGLWEVSRRIYSFDPAATLEVRSLAMVDRTGFPAQRALVIRENERHRRFWRWDVPPLGHDGSCPLCALCSRWHEMRGLVLVGSLRSRIEYWLTQWTPVHVEDGRFDVGVPPRPLPLGVDTRFSIERTKSGQEVAHHVSHETSTSLVSIATEIARSTTRKDYPLKKGQAGASPDGLELDPETRMEIVVSQVLLFPESLSSADRFDRLVTLLDLLWEASRQSITTALSAMVVQTDASLNYALWQHCAALIESKGFPHDDALINAISLYHAAGEPPLGSTKHLGWELFQLCRQSSDKYREPLSRVFRVFGWNPESIHRNLLPDLLRLSDHEPHTLSQALLMMEGLAEALEILRPAITEGTELKNKHDAATLRLIVHNVRTLRDRFGPYHLEDLNSNQEETGETGKKQIELKAFFDEAYTFLFGPNGSQRRYIDALTVRLEAEIPAEFILQGPLKMVNDDWSRLLEDKGPAVSRAWVGPPSVRFVESILPKKRLHLYFDVTIKKAVAELISNVMHRDKELACPWSGYENFPKADLWGRMVAAEDGASVTIQLVNAIADNGDVQIQRTSSIFHLEAIGGTINQNIDRNRQWVCADITIPTTIGLARA